MKRFLLLLFLPIIAVAAGGKSVTIGVLTYDIQTNSSTTSVKGVSSSVTSVVIPETVTYNGKSYTVSAIGSKAFQGNTQITNVTIPNSVKYIYSNAFSGCTGLTSITIPYSVTEIGSYAFYGCTELTSVTIPSSVTSIGSAAFYGCTGLTNITIPSSVTSIGINTFKDTSIKKVFFKGAPSTIDTNAFGDQLEVIDIPDWGLWSSLSDKLAEYKNLAISINGQRIDNLTIDDSVLDIPAGAYKGLKFKSVTISANVKTMGANCFTPGNIIKTIWMPDVVPSGDPACAKGKVNYCSSDAYSNSEAFNATDNFIQYLDLSSVFTVDGVTYVLDETTDGGWTVDAIDCDYDAAPIASLTIGPEVTYKSFSFPVRNIREYACYDNDSIVGSLHIANNGYVGGWAFFDCDDIQTLTVENQGNVGTSAFESSRVTTKATVTNAGYIGHRAFADITGTFAAEVNNNGYIGTQAFHNDNLTTVEVGSNATTIDTEAFYGGSISESATIRNTGDIGTSAFANTEGNYDADIDNTGLIAQNAFQQNKIKTLLIGNHVTTIGANAFEGSIISASSTLRNNGDIFENAFADVSGNYAADINNVGRVGEKAFKNNTMYTLLVGNDVTSIETSAFNRSNISESVTLNNNGYLADYAFYSSSMKTLDINNTVTNVGLAAFRGGSIQERAYINHSGTTGRAAFSRITGGFNADIQCSGILPDSCFYASKMNTVTIGNNITSLEKNCFESSYFTSATIGSSVASIKNRGFAQATGFTSMVLPNNVVSMDAQAFKKCTTMQEITLSRGLSLINEGTFSDCSSLKSIFLPLQIDSIGNNVFDDCTVMHTVTFEDKVGDYKLGYSAVKKSPLFYTAGLDSVYVGGRLKYDIRAEAYHSPFRAHSSLRALRVTDNEVRIYDREFENCTALKNIYMGAGIDGIGQYAFSGCTALERVKVGTGVRPMGQYSFAGCTSLKDIDLSNVVTIHNNSFDGCSALRQIRLPHTTMSVENQTFLQCTALKDLIIEDRADTLRMGFNYNNTSYQGITGVGTPLFSDCQLDSVYIGGPITYSKTQEDGYSPFYYNKSLRTVFVTNNEKQVYENEFWNCINMTTIRLGEGVENIETHGFLGCAGLLYFTFGSTLQNIGAYAFADCKKITTIISHATTPPVCGEQAVRDINKFNCTIYVPAGSLEAYKTADQWKQFFLYEPLDEPEPSIPGDINGDNDVDVADIVAIIDKVLEGSEDIAYDVNSDGSVDVADIVAVIDYVLSYGGASQAPARRAKAASASANESVLTAHADLDGIALGLNNDVAYTAFQFVLTLPEGARLADVIADADRLEGHTLRFRELGDGRYFVLGYASDNVEIYGTQGTLLHLLTTAFDSGTADVSDVRFIDTKGRRHLLQGLSVDAWADSATGIAQVDRDKVNGAWYDLGGRRVDNGPLGPQGRLTHQEWIMDNGQLPRGIYLHNGKKVVIK